MLKIKMICKKVSKNDSLDSKNDVFLLEKMFHAKILISKQEEVRNERNRKTSEDRYRVHYSDVSALYNFAVLHSTAILYAQRILILHDMVSIDKRWRNGIFSMGIMAAVGT